MCTGNWIKLYALVVALTLFIVTEPRDVYAVETSVFKITDTDGYVGLRYRYDEDITEQNSNPQTKETRSVFEEKINVQTHAYVYHPNLLKVNLGAGVLFSQEKLKTTSGESNREGTLYDLDTNLMFLEKKPYPLTLFYNMSHPSVTENVTDVYVQENEKYGMNFMLRQPLSPVTLNFETYKQSTNGSSFTQVIEDRNTYQSVRASTSLKNGGNVQLSHTKNEQESMSGSKMSLIKPFNVTTKTTDINSRFIFGYQRNINFNFIATQTEQEQDRDLKELRLSPSLTWNHSNDFNSYYRYSLLERQQSGFKNNESLGATGLSYQWNDNLFSNAELHFSDNTATGLKLNNTGARGSISYKHKLPIGLLHFNVGVNYDDYDRVASNAVQIPDTQYTLTDANRVTLVHENIDISSIEVRRNDNGLLLTELVDYYVISIGNETQIEKIINSQGTSSLVVQIRYKYDPGGSAAYSSLGQSYQTSLQINEYFTTYINYRDSNYSLKSGSPSFPLDTSDTTSYGVQVNYPFQSDVELTIGGEAINEKHNENTSSYIKKSIEVFMQAALPLSSHLYFSSRRLQVDNLYSSEDVDLTGYILRLKFNPAERLHLSLQLNDDKNTGGSLPRHSRNIGLTGQWRVRKLLVEFGAKKVIETQNQNKHERNVLTATLRREF